jgi:hypothetical protein
MDNFKERFGLDYLSRGLDEQPPSPAGAAAAPAQPPQPTLPPGLDDALIAYGSRILSYFKNSPNQSLKVFDLAQSAGIRVETLLPVLNYMASKGMVARVAEDPVGNDTYQLGAAGQRLS